MAHIPVEKKGGFPWWILLLLLLLGALALWFLEPFADDDDLVAEVEQDDPVEAVVDVDRPRLVRDVSDLIGDVDPAMLLGMEVELEDVEVEALEGDSTFWIDPGMDEERIFVVLRGLGESQHGPGDGSDGRYNVDPNETMDVEGTVVALDPADIERWGLEGTDAAEVEARQFYIRARSLDV